MAELLIKLEPLEPYFFGGEGSYGETKYFIRSLKTPGQTTLFGLLRYLGLTPEERIAGKPKDGTVVGEKSFSLADPKRTFGMINNISPLYLSGEGGRLYGRTPLLSMADDKRTEEVCTNAGSRKFEAAYDDKNDLNESWSCLRELQHDVSARGQITVNDNELFFPVESVGISKIKKPGGTHEKAFFKRQSWRMAKGFGFAFFADVENAFPLCKRVDTPYSEEIVFLGQKKTAFKVTFHGLSDEDEGLKNLLSSGHIYVQSDTFVPNTAALTALYKNSSYACVLPVTYRSFETVYDNKIENHRKRFSKENLYRLIRAGSVFKSDDPAAFVRAVNDASGKAEIPEAFVRVVNEESGEYISNAKKAGFNHLLAY